MSKNHLPSETDAIAQYQPKTRQELYDRIRQTSKDTVIYTEMVRLGFWPSEQTMPNVPGQMFTRQAEIQQELNAIFAEQKIIEDPAKLRQMLRQKRMQEALQKRQETKERRERERQERALAWQEIKQKEIHFLGTDVSRGLQESASNEKQLKKLGLPRIPDAPHLAQQMKISVPALRFLSYARRVSKIHHYQRFCIPKKTGGTRTISAPMPRLKQAQYWILQNILAPLTYHDAAHGFVPHRSITSNAAPHVGADIVVNFDLKDFFPSITYPRIKGLFAAFGYSEHIATILALLCTESDVEQVALDGQSYFVACGPRHLPQGAPTSPALTNLLCRRLDRRLTGLAQSLQLTYTRYADDLTFSGQQLSSVQLGNLLRKVADIVEHEDFSIHPDKTRIMHKGRRQEVTGLVVNQKLSIDRRTMRRFRATLFQIEKDGPQGKHWCNSPNLFASLRGFASYIAMVDPLKGLPLLARIQQIIQTHQQPTNP